MSRQGSDSNANHGFLKDMESVLRRDFEVAHDAPILDPKNSAKVCSPRKNSSGEIQENTIAEDDDVVVWEETGEDEDTDNDRIALGLIGKLWTDRQPNPNAFISTMKSVWIVMDGVEINNIGRNLYRIQFFHLKDKQKILNGQPWHFDKYPLLLAKFDNAIKPSDLSIVHLPLWV